MRFSLIGLIGKRLTQTVIALYVVQFASYLIPLITIPYIARVLGPGEWGRLAVAQSAGSYVVVVVEFGFGLSATREVARHRSDQRRVTQILSSVLAAKLALTLAAVLIVAAAFPLVPALRDSVLLVSMALAWAVARSFSLMWFFQGLEQVRLAAMIEVAGSALGASGIFLIVHKPSDAWKVFLCQGTGCAVAVIVLLVVAWREFPPVWPTWHSIWEGLVMGGSMFIFRSAVTLYTVGNALILSLFVPPQIVGYYAGAEKISKALLGMMQPLNQAIFPRISHLVQKARRDAERAIRLSLAVMGTGGILAGGFCCAFARPLVNIILGAQFAPAVTVLRILSLLPPLIALSNVLGIQWMIPLGLDSVFNRIIVAAGVLNVILALFLAPRLQAIGMATSVVVAETVVTIAVYFALHQRGISPIRATKESVTCIEREGISAI